jgi:hypothetical protein
VYIHALRLQFSPWSQTPSLIFTYLYFPG